MPDFDDVLKNSLADKVPEQKWFFIAFRNDITGVFSYAAIVDDENSIKASGRAYRICETDNSDSLSNFAEIPAHRLPDASYRNRRLNRDEVIALWSKGKE